MSLLVNMKRRKKSEKNRKGKKKEKEKKNEEGEEKRKKKKSNIIIITTTTNVTRGNVVRQVFEEGTSVPRNPFKEPVVQDVVEKVVVVRGGCGCVARGGY